MVRGGEYRNGRGQRTPTRPVLHLSPPTSASLSQPHAQIPQFSSVIGAGRPALRLPGVIPPPPHTHPEPVLLVSQRFSKY